VSASHPPDATSSDPVKGVETCVGKARVPEASRIGAILKTVGLFVITACAEILGCYLPYLWLRKNESPWLLLPAGISLAAFAWLLSLRPEGESNPQSSLNDAHLALSRGRKASGSPDGAWSWRKESQTLVVTKGVRA